MSSYDDDQEEVLRIQLRSECPCKSGDIYNDCCRPYHIGKKRPATAIHLMKARYSAYFLRKVDYLVDTHHSDTRPAGLKKQLEDTIYDFNWVYLRVLGSSKGKEEDKKGKIEFTVKYFHEDELVEITVNSRFRKVRGHWKYYDDKG